MNEGKDMNRDEILAMLAQADREMILMARMHGDTIPQVSVGPRLQAQIDRIEQAYQVTVVCRPYSWHSLRLAGSVIGNQVVTLLVHPKLEESETLRTLFHEEVHLRQDESAFPSYESIEGYFAREHDTWKQVPALAAAQGCADVITAEWLAEQHQYLNQCEELAFCLADLLGCSSMTVISRLQQLLLTLTDPFLSDFIREQLGLGEGEYPTVPQLIGLLGYSGQIPADILTVGIDRTVLRGGWSSGHFSAEAASPLEVSDPQRAAENLANILRDVAEHSDEWSWAEDSLTSRWEWQRPRLVRTDGEDGEQIIAAWYDVMQSSGLTAFIRVVQALTRSRPLNTPLRMMWRVWENDNFPLYEVELEWKESKRPAWRLYCQASRHKRFYRQYEDALRLYINGFRRWAGIYPSKESGYEVISRIAWLWGDTVGEAPDHLLTNREIA